MGRILHHSVNCYSCYHQYRFYAFCYIFTQSDLMYELELKMQKNAEGSSTILAYIKGALFGAFYPFLLINYLGEKKWLKLLS